MKEDFEAVLIDSAKNIRSDSTEEATKTAIQYVAMKEMVDQLIDWMPIELEKGE